MLWLTGERPRTVRTIGNKICSRGTKFEYDDFAAATMSFESGLIGRITANFGCVHGHQHIVRVFGTDGTFLCDDRGVRWQSQRDPAPPAINLDYEPLPSSKHVLIGDFSNAVVMDKPVETQLDFDVMSVCIASDESQRHNREMEINYV
jgi:predicted dehydrogenase